MGLTSVEFIFDGRTRRDVTPESQCILLFFLSDNLVENDESFRVYLSTNDSSVIFSSSSADVVILNNDSKNNKHSNYHNNY